MERKRGGFKSFVRRRDGKTLVPKASLSELSEVSGVVLNSLLKVLRGDNINLINAFTWSSTPQGGSYWNVRDLGRVPLSPEDYQWLQELYDYHSLQGGEYANLQQD